MNRLAATAALALSVAAGLLIAGPLNPPGGPVAPTYKTLSEIEPRIAVNAANTPGTGVAQFKITAPGSYYLTGNITGNINTHGLEIDADSVTLDLNGFEVVDPAPQLGSSNRYGIKIALNRSNIAVKNGSVRNWRSGGIYCQSNGCTFDRLRISGGNGDGLYGAAKTIVTDCVVSGCNGTGILLAESCLITNCTSRSNTGSGFQAAFDSIFTACTAEGNTLAGFTMIGASCYRCSSRNNSTYGFEAGGSVIDCDASGNGVYAIRAGIGSLIRGNTCSQSPSFPVIYLADWRARVENNTLYGGSYGIFAPGGGATYDNLVIGNFSTNAATAGFSIPSTNVVGPIVTAAGTITSTSPWANFSR